MSNYTEVIAIVEGKTERNFIQLLIAPYLSQKGIYVTPILCNKRGSKGGDVKFSRLVHDIHRYLKQRSNTIITTCLDLYGLKEWPQKQEILKEPNHDQMIHKLYSVTDVALKEIFDEYTVNTRIIPYFSIYEFEALLFSDENTLAKGLACDVRAVHTILQEFGEPEKINNSPQTAPSKRLDLLSPRKNFKKTSEGITIASEIGIDAMRNKCPQFHHWLCRLESLQP